MKPCHFRNRLTRTISAGSVLMAAFTVGNFAGAAYPACDNPRFTTWNTNGGWSNGGFYVHNNMWNVANYEVAETLYACAYNDWYVRAKANNNNGDGAVKTYPNVHKNYNNVPIGSFKSITSTFAATGPHVGIYNVAYDIWVNGVATAGCTEFMIWTENYKQVPSGSKVTTAVFGGRSYDVYTTSSNGYIAFVPAPFTTGSVDLLEIIKWTISKGWLRANSTLGQICFGVEIVSTDNTVATFTVTDFSLTTVNNQTSATENTILPVPGQSFVNKEAYSISGRRIMPRNSAAPAMTAITGKRSNDIRGIPPFAIRACAGITRTNIAQD